MERGKPVGGNFDSLEEEGGGLIRVVTESGKQ